MRSLQACIVLVASTLLTACGSIGPAPAVPSSAAAPSNRSLAAILKGRGKLAFRINVTTGGVSTANIYLMSSEFANPSSRSQLVQITHSAWNDQASWSLDGTKLLYTQESAYNGPTSRIVVVNADGTNTKPLTAFNDKDSVPCFSPTGAQIAFRRDSSGNTQIWTMNADGSNQKYLAAGISPTWSPNGAWIAFSNNQSLWEIAPNGTGLHQLTHLTGVSAFEPSWSPDGTTIAFTGVTGSSPNIWLVNANGSNARQLTHDVYDLESNWSPDSALVVFDSWSGGWPGGFAHLGVIGRNGTGEADLTTHIQNSGIEPAWQPI